MSGERLEQVVARRAEQQLVLGQRWQRVRRQMQPYLGKVSDKGKNRDHESRDVAHVLSRNLPGFPQ